MNTRIVFRLLSSIENASFVGEGRTGAACDSATGKGGRRGSAAGRRAASPLRAAGRLKNQIQHATRGPLGLLGIASEPCTLQARTSIHTVKQGAARWLSLRFIRGYNIRHGPYGIFGNDTGISNLPPILR